jgi:hypothetical protein
LTLRREKRTECAAVLSPLRSPPACARIEENGNGQAQRASAADTGQDRSHGRRAGATENPLDGDPLTGYAAARFRFGFGFTSVFLSPSLDGVLGSQVYVA